MQISPRYDADPLIVIDGPADDQREPATRQRRRFAAALAGFTDDEWRAPSRCEGWTNQDVVAHLTGTNQFWTVSLTSAVAGTPTRYLAGFDPQATPAQLVDARRSLSPAEGLEQFVASNDALLDVVAGLDDAGWAAMAEAPPGHLPARLIAHHALWDAWVHERDVLLPLGRTPEEAPDEVVSCLRYAAALGPAFAITNDTATTGRFAIAATDPDVALVLDLGAAVHVSEGAAPLGLPVLRGRAVDLVEALSIRCPLGPDAPDEWRQVLSGLATVFDVEVP